MKRGHARARRLFAQGLTALAVLLGAGSAAAFDLNELWNHRDPAGSEQRFREALKTARGDDPLILQTQIARTFSLRRDFEQARAVLAAVEPQLATAGAEARVRWQLEYGRSWASATHPPGSTTPASRERARAAWQSALDQARAARLDGLAVDALHMFAFLAKEPAEQLRWSQAALDLALASAQPEARRWQASARNNVGLALHQLGRLDEALHQFQAAAALRAGQGHAGNTRVAQWMVAWTLRGLGRGDEALAIQLRLADEGEAAGEPDAHVYAELEALYRQRGDLARAQTYAQRRMALQP